MHNSTRKTSVLEEHNIRNIRQLTEMKNEAEIELMEPYKTTQIKATTRLFIK